MNRRLMVVALLATLLLSAAAMAEPTKERPEAPRAGSYAEALAMSAQTGKPVIVDFFAVW